MSLARIVDNEFVRKPDPSGRASIINQPSLTVGLLTRRRRFCRSFILKVSLLNMKLLLKLLLGAAGIFLAVNSLTLGQAARHHADRVWSAADKAPSTENLYKQKCSKCHGADGSGDTSLGRIFGTPDFTDPGWWAKHPNSGELVSMITRGKKNMPAFGKKLTKAQIASLAGYVQRFKR